jgi:hypothetical protein
MSENGRALMQQSYSWDAVARHLAGVYARA